LGYGDADDEGIKSLFAKAMGDFIEDSGEAHPAL